MRAGARARRRSRPRAQAAPDASDGGSLARWLVREPPRRRSSSQNPNPNPNTETLADPALARRNREQPPAAGARELVGQWEIAGRSWLWLRLLARRRRRVKSRRLSAGRKKGEGRARRKARVFRRSSGGEHAVPARISGDIFVSSLCRFVPTSNL